MPGAPRHTLFLEREGIFNLDFFRLRKLRYLDRHLQSFLMTVRQSSQDTSGILLSISCLKITHHLRVWHQLPSDRKRGNTEKRKTYIMMMMISRLLFKDDRDSQVLLLCKLIDNFRAGGISAIIRNFVIDSPWRPPPASGRGPRLQILGQTGRVERLAYNDAIYQGMLTH